MLTLFAVALDRLHRELRLVNESAAASLAGGLEEGVDIEIVYTGVRPGAAPLP
ncbi:MAG TPA: hypothetical protein VIJ90_07535 [Gemmatimonadaceae bacterium]